MMRVLLVLIYCLTFSLVGFAQNSVPQTLVLDGEILLKNRSLATSEKKSALDELVKDAEKIVKAGKVYSVMNKVQIPPSGDKHDYMSQAPYWWADPSKPDGLPYIRRDGERNPELKNITDKEELSKLITESELTAIAYFFTGQEKFAEHSAKLIRTWFIDAKTIMNPNLKFGQGIPGINTGRGIGIIETRELYRVIDAAILIKASKFWSDADHNSLKQWFVEYAKWLMESELGKDEAVAKNNHGTHYDAQLISFLLFTGQTELAEKQLETSKKRIVSQLEKNGSLRLELERTLSWNYSFMNLYGFLTIARLAEHTKVNLWNFEADGKGLKKAVEWLTPFAKNEKKWTHQQIKAPEMDNTYKVFSLAGNKYKSQEYQDLATKIAKETKLTPFEILTR
jgi:Alginate lyase